MRKEKKQITPCRIPIDSPLPFPSRTMNSEEIIKSCVEEGDDAREMIKGKREQEGKNNFSNTIFDSKTEWNG